MATVYISGPMTGMPNLNRDMFMAAEAILRLRYQTVINPARNELSGKPTWADYMRVDLAMLLKADIIALLPGWEKSKGALLEVRIARDLGMKILFLDESELANQISA